MSRKSPLPLALVLALSLAPGCRALGRGGQGFYEVSAGLFTPNPVAFVPFYGGLGVGLIAGSPLLLLSWPLAALFGPPLEGQWGLAARLAPALALGVAVGDLLALPFWPFGLPFEPERPEPQPDRTTPAPSQGPGLAGEPRSD